MAEIKLKGKTIHTSGHLPALHSHAPPFLLVNHDLQDVTLDSFKGKKKLIATVPSLDTGTCSTETKHLNNFAKKHPHVAILVVSTDLPFAQKRFCNQEQVENITTLSMMRDKEFGRAYGVLIVDGPLAGILARSILVLDEKDKLLYMELVPEIAEEPDYHKAFHALVQ